ncbi:GntR family transcriptional regulator [Brevibacillus sp. SYP-B805]|uniref:GntR family transcriptional regulator n=1 Tax=Brevibacillus sp. SYP-B805 TaxID=1578199 RepID=UPI0013EE2534|nr:GntR family transcriptional regulator [Brevibacillus sp. SYP-B805]NGQ95764.1 GntR family transcriptional regulator [Brevibacillus sp. SYP-B805]
MNPDFQLKRDEPVPLYHQIAQIVEKEIEEGMYKPGDLFTTEQELQKRFQVSRATVRKAFEALEQKGLLIRLVGKGTFVGSPRLQLAQPHLLSFTEEMKQLGITPGTQILGISTVYPSPKVREQLHLGKQESVLQIRRLRTGNGNPILFVTHYLPTWLQPDDPNVFGESLYKFLEEHKGIYLQEAVHKVGAGPADSETASLLQIAAGEPVITFSRTSFDRQGRAIIYEEGKARPDSYEYQVRLRRQ